MRDKGLLQFDRFLFNYLILRGSLNYLMLRMFCPLEGYLLEESMCLASMML